MIAPGQHPRDCGERPLCIDMDYQRFFESSPNASYSASPDGTIVACNRAFLTLFGFKSVEEAQANGMASLYPKRYVLADFVKRLATSKRRCCSHVYEDQQLRGVDGTPIYALAGAAGHFEREQLVQIDGFFVEESQLWASRQGLYEARRTEALARFTANIAANFDNLVWIAGDRLAASENRSLLASAHGTIRSASHLRGQLLAFSRMQALQPAAVNLNTLLRRLAAMFARTLRDDTKLVFDLAPGLGAARVDHVQFERVMLELVANAGDAIPTGGQVLFKTENVKVSRGRNPVSAFGDAVAPGKYALLSVTDNGIGMDKTVCDRVFEPFFSTKGQGRGLGLSVVHGIIKQSRGFVCIKSAPDEGTKFSIFLPRTDEEVSYHDTLLVVEGDEFLRRQMREQFKRFGYEVLEAADGFEACKVAANHEGRIDVLVAEIEIPRMSGPELAERLLMIRPSLQIVFLASDVELDVLKHMQILRADVIAKPFQLTTLVTTVRALLCSHPS